MRISDKQLAHFVSKRLLVCIRREEIDTRAIQAFLLGFSDNLLLIQYIYDFHVDGQLILRRDDITAITSDATDGFQRKLLKNNNLFQHIDFEFNATLTSFPALLNSQPPNAIVILENERLDDSDFWMGRYVDSTDETIRLHEFSGAGNWEDSLSSIAAAEVTCCQLNTNYTNVYARYFKDQPAPEKPV